MDALTNLIIPIVMLLVVSIGFVTVSHLLTQIHTEGKKVEALLRENEQLRTMIPFGEEGEVNEELQNM